MKSIHEAKENVKALLVGILLAATVLVFIYHGDSITLFLDSLREIK